MPGGDPLAHGPEQEKSVRFSRTAIMRAEAALPGTASPPKGGTRLALATT